MTTGFWRRPWGLEMWAETEVGRDWLAAYRLVSEGGAPAVAEVRLYPKDEREWRSPLGYLRDVRPGDPALPSWPPRPALPPGGITAKLLRAVPLWQCRAAMPGVIRVLHHTSKQQGDSDVSDVSDELARLGWPESAIAPPPLAGRRPRGDRFLAEVAAAYVEALEAGTRQLTEAVGVKVGVGPTRARDLIHRARASGLLTGGGKRGRVGGTLTAAARALLGLDAADPTALPAPGGRGRRKGRSDR
jgi:hypothetical protein